MMTLTGLKGMEQRMDAGTLKSLSGYDAWANERIFRCCDQLSQDQFTRDADIPWGSIRDQLVHQFLIQQRWLSWIDGSLSGEDAYSLEADPNDYPGVAEVEKMWERVDVQTHQFLQRATRADLDREFHADLPDGKFSLTAGQVLLHVMQHSMQHRTEVAMELTRCGASPGDIDYIFFLLSE
jgi:uncharacterized damage-inducible protein DinB